MPTEKRRISITVEDWMWDAIEDYRYEKRLISKSAAAVNLISDALSAKCNSEEIPIENERDLAKRAAKRIIAEHLSDAAKVGENK